MTWYACSAMCKLDIWSGLWCLTYCTQSNKITPKCMHSESRVCINVDSMHDHSHDAQCMKTLACSMKVPCIYKLCAAQDHALVLESLMYSNPLLTLGLPYLLKTYICPASGTFSCRSSQTSTWQVANRLVLQVIALLLQAVC